MKKIPRPVKPTLPIQAYSKEIRKTYSCSYGTSIKDIIDWAAAYGVSDMSSIKFDTAHSDSFSDSSCDFEMISTVSVRLSDEDFEKETEKYNKDLEKYNIEKKEYDAYYNERDKQKRIQLENEEKALLKDLLKKYPQ